MVQDCRKARIGISWGGRGGEEDNRGREKMLIAKAMGRGSRKKRGFKKVHIRGLGEGRGY